ncbi:type II toxin-antitoxin system HigB family toxin [Kamptonema sp. UHCC 0994]|uniref:type II toxin-antitoxin system HigB family toxin n=1 Tax=Kamptonema sp. UHCC 0994 TaxID=3031329 RepID=UPI0023BA47E2|nr:type II toxin-antitoxin system HigB family toxin [Kamptonema sp. UHCC 0994]MDF0556877.1 type II toxin-antitoxin system HigB family toxin [Kamptonema sp. UHCC 0994]
MATKAKWSNLVEVQSVFPKAEAVGNFTVFNIKGNNYRLIVSDACGWLRLRAFLTTNRCGWLKSDTCQKIVLFYVKF